MTRVYISQIDCSAHVLEKINNLHGVTLDEVKEAVLFPARPIRAVRLQPTHDDPRAPRVILEGVTLPSRRIRVVLYPVDEREGTWRLGTAVPLASGTSGRAG